MRAPRHDHVRLAVSLALAITLLFSLGLGVLAPDKTECGTGFALGGTETATGDGRASDAGSGAGDADRAALATRTQLVGATASGSDSTADNRTQAGSGSGPDADTTGEVVVAYAPGQRETAENNLQLQGASILHVDTDAGFIVAETPVGTEEDAFATAAEELGSVRYAEPVYVRRAAYVPNDPRLPSQWGMTRVGAPAAWDITRGDHNVKIAVVDTGVDLTHPDLAANLDTANDWDFVDRDATAQDEQGHGTHVAGIVAAVADNGVGIAGLANGCTVLPVRVLDSNGDGTTTNVASGIRWAADHGADIINLSLGSSRSSRIEREACTYAAEKGCVIVAAAGNDDLYEVICPARYPEVVAVAATMSNDRTYAGNYGPQVDLTAPGTSILSTYLRQKGSSEPAYEYLSGTSMAAPTVSASAALIASEHPNWTAEQIIAALKTTATNLGPVGHDDTFGFGMVRPDLALALEVPPTMPNKGDNNIPGISLPSASFSDSLQARYDTSDVYAVELEKGDGLTAELTTQGPGFSASLSLYGPEAVDVDLDTPLYWSSAAEPLQSIRYQATSSGIYYLRVSSYGGSGTYILSAGKTGLALSAPERVSWGKAAPIVAEATKSGVAASGVSVTLEEKLAGGTWAPAEARQTDTNGRATFTRTLVANTQYRTTATIDGTKRTSAERSVAIEPAVTVRITRTEAAVGSHVAVSGEFNPRHPAGGDDVWVRCYRNGELVSSVIAWDMSAIRPGNYSRYRTSVLVDTPGVWEFRAYIPELAGVHGAFESEGLKVTVH